VLYKAADGASPQRVAMETDLIQVVKRLVEEDPDVGAIIPECTNMPPYSRDIRQVTRLPVFDVAPFVNMVYVPFGNPYYEGVM
jgi:hypothetical protein